MMYGGMAEPSLPALSLVWCLVSFIGPGPLDRRTSTLRRRLATGLARLTSLFKRNSTSCLIGTHADVLSWLRLRTVFRHPCLQTRGRGIVAAKGDALERLPAVRTFKLRPIPFALQSRLPHPRRSYFASAGWDSLIARSDHPRLRYSDELSTA